MKVSVSVVTHQSAPWIDACLDAVAAQAFVHEVLVVDSASTDDTVARIEARHPRADLDAAATNLGCGAGHNRNWARASGDALLVLNPDVVLAPGALAALALVLDARPEVGAAVPRLVSMSDPTRLDSAGIRWSPGRTRFVDRGRGEPCERFSREQEVFGGCGACLLLRGDAIDAVSRSGERPFAERFFMYYEDVDLAWRLRRAGWATRYVPRAEARHVRGGSGGRDDFVEYHLVRNRLWCSVRNASASEFVRELPGLALFEAAKLAQAARRPHLRRALRDQLHGLPDAWSARRTEGA